MRRFALPAAVAAVLSIRAVLSSNAYAGCFRLGERLAIIGIDIAGVRVGSIRTIVPAGTAIAGTIDIYSLLAARRRC